MKPTPYEMLMDLLKSDDKAQNENRHADFLARELDKIIPPQTKASKGGAA